MTHRLDGVRPRQAICQHCGYRFGGIEIQDGEITCPECGRASRFELQSRAEELERLRHRIRFRRRVLGAIVLVAIAAILVIAQR